MTQDTRDEVKYASPKRRTYLPKTETPQLRTLSCALHAESDAFSCPAYSRVCSIQATYYLTGEHTMYILCKQGRTSILLQASIADSGDNDASNQP